MARLVDVAHALAGLEERLERLAPRPRGPCEVWWDVDGGRVRNGATGDELSGEAFARLHPAAYAVRFDEMDEEADHEQAD